MHKNITNCKLSLSIVLDFLILVFIFVAAALAIFGSKAILYPTVGEEKAVRVMTEPLADEFSSRLRVGDDVFDPITKKKLGKIESLSPLSDGERVRFILSFPSSDTPRSNCLRTREVWFYIRVIDEKEAEELISGGAMPKEAEGEAK